MNTQQLQPSRPSRLRPQDCRLEDLLAVLRDTTPAQDYPLARRVEQGILVYEAADLVRAGSSAAGRESAYDELSHALSQGPGIVVVEGAFDVGVLDRVTAAFQVLIDAQHGAGVEAGDHFAAPGTNDRVWNALEKLAVDDPRGFVDYYANDLVALAATAWLGPGYQVTSQINVVNPGGVGQTVHRDYHLGFQSPEVSATYPAHAHDLSPVLTLQGAVAHVDMPLASGPTLYLPHSQKYRLGYLAYWLPEFQEYFRSHHVQLPLHMGDAVFFNPALFHAAGSNVSSSIRRMANLLQISSAFGRAMESVDRERMLNAIYPILRQEKSAGRPDRDLDNVIAATAEGYPFPTNLDRDQPVDGMCPPSQADVVRAALTSDASLDQLTHSLQTLADAKRSH
ncbi:phytanoyl-CoA dioxygenase family protein [Leekyejoonella antrihumi]|uniref:Phytanoyl-CoA dioxygenase n=1 Tax=Leekyejoonella antrihumi TaxID=1660198 RepID=A0A563E6Y7_9MICO|nr:phytanoyl-CoA dioxygenase family protein [Leekyejoonella antrihumi]TWP38286.1 phytanoyl-CoA dioxygenase [Leekyejoonella antrihumi]